MKKLFFASIIGMTLYSCGGSNTEAPKKEEAASTETEMTTEEYDPNRGEGKFENVELLAFDAAKAAEGQKVADTKCMSCHKTTDEKLVGPGWKGITKRQQPTWIMNFITNPDPMIDKDPKLQAQLELCMVRMPNQNLSDDEAFQILEFMRQNDGEK